MNAPPPPLPPRPSPAPDPVPATPPPPPAPSAPIRDLEALFRELVTVLVPPSIPVTPPPPSIPATDALAASLLPINQKQLEILQRAEAERANRVDKDKAEREWRRTIHLTVMGVVILLEIVGAVVRAYLSANTAPPAVAAPSPAPTTIYIAPSPAPSGPR